jgi:hypothetical protein
MHNTSVKADYLRNKQYKTVPNDWKYIKRHTDYSKGLARNARDLLFAALYQIVKYGHAVLTHEELSKITDTKHDQTCNLIKQLGFVLHFEFFRSTTIDGKNYRDGYIFTKNQNTDDILENPTEYFANSLDKNKDTSPNLLCDIAEENQRNDEPLLIYTKKKYKNDNQDNQNYQFQNSNFLEEKTEQVETEVLTENIKCDEIHVDGLTKEENSYQKAVYSPKTIEFVKNAEDLKINTSVSKQDARPTEIGLDGKTYWTTPLRYFEYSEKMLKEIISKCNRNRQHYTTAKVISIIQNILEKYPDKKIRGGRAGFKKYMIAAINGENDYTEKGAMSDEEKLTSIAEKNAIEAQETWDLYKNGGVQYF